MRTENERGFQSNARVTKVGYICSIIIFWGLPVSLPSTCQGPGLLKEADRHLTTLGDRVL